ncbi:hypothetical protein BGW39_008016 [Mortierella sp. 14UC]|nr:hypothetical protein BGW39_008016 [Mortierella sp. 14UC]
MSAENKPTVLIVGAGLGGLMLGALLEKAEIPYTIFERTTVVKPLGSAMVVGPTLLPLFEQLGIYDELLSLGKHLTHTFGYKQNLEPMKPLDIRAMEEFTGYQQWAIPRPKLYEIVRRLVPDHRIHFGRRVLNITEEAEKATIHLSNGDTFDGDIIVGADGAYSAVRQRMYDQLKAKGELPQADHEDLPFSCTCLVGQTKVLDPEQFPIVDFPDCHFTTVHGKDQPFTWHVFNTSQKTLCWMTVRHLNKTSTKAAMEQRFRDSNNSEWGDHPAQTMCDETRDFQINIGGGKTATMGDVYELTPKEYISKVMLEDKVFKTWHHRRYVLLGDACHKLNPFGGHGAVTAMHDALGLANLLYAMPSRTTKEVTRIFEEYHEERYPNVMEAYNNSIMLSKMFNTGLVSTLLLSLISHIPLWVFRLTLSKSVRFRPQCGFLPIIEQKGTAAAELSPSQHKARVAFEERQKKSGTVAAHI